MESIILDPDFEDFNGVYAGGINIAPPIEKFNYTEMIRYMKDNNFSTPYFISQPNGLKYTQIFGHIQAIPSHNILR